MSAKKLLLITALSTTLIACDNDSSSKDFATCIEAGDACKKFTVLHTNDNHGRFWENSDGEYGMAARKTLIDAIRAEVAASGGETLLLSGGDINTGVPESDLQDAEPDFIGMNLIGYDAMAVGNHEFDNSLAVLEAQRELAEFPMLAANIYTANGERYFDAYKVFTINGVRIAVIGLTTEDTSKIGNPEFITDLQFRDPTSEIAQLAAQIKNNKEADIVIATTHMGHYENGMHGSNAPGDVAMAKKLEAGLVQAIIGGHSQNPVCMEPGTDNYADFSAGDSCVPDMQNGTYIMQAHEWGKFVGRADFEYFSGKLNLASYELIPVNLKDEDDQLIGEAIVADEDVKNTLQQYQDKGAEKLNEVIADVDGKLEGDRNVVRSQQTNLGHLIAIAQSEQVSADFGVMNSGGVRDSIAAGDISYRDVLLVQPFGNMVTLATMTGDELTNYLNVVATMSVGSGAYAQLPGIKMDIDCQTQSVTIHEVAGKTFNSSDSYTFTVPSFNAAGGDGYPVLSTINSGFVDADVLYQYLKKKGSIKTADYEPVAGDLQYINSSDVNGCNATN